MHPAKCRHYSNPSMHGKCLGGKNCNFLHDPECKKAYDAFIQAANVPQAKLSFMLPGFCPYGIPVKNSFNELNQCPPGCQEPYCANSHVSFDPSTEKLAQQQELNPTVNKWDLKNLEYEPQRTDSQGNLTMPSKDEISFNENWYRQKALKEYRNLYPKDPVEAKDFFVKDKPSKATPKEPSSAESQAQAPSTSTDRKIYALQGKAKGPKRRYLVDSGASFHLTSKESLSQKERKTLRKLPFPLDIQTANGVVTLEWCADVYVHLLQITVTCMILSGTVSVLSLGRIVDDNNFDFAWRHKKVCTLKNNVTNKVVECPASHHVPWIFPCKGTAVPAEDLQENTPPVENVAPPAKDEVPPPPKPDASFGKRPGKSKPLG
jgi:hypothetical protein